MREGVERHYVELGVPEHVPFIRFAGKGASADGDTLIFGIRCADEVVCGEPQRLLEEGVSLHLDVGIFPA